MRLISHKRVFKLSHGHCWYCGQHAENRDHVIPRSRGGSNHHSNIVPCCKKCNSLKGDRTIEEYREHIKHLWQLAKTNKRCMKRPIALIGVVGFKFYFEIAGLSQYPSDSLTDCKLGAYSSHASIPVPPPVHSAVG